MATDIELMRFNFWILNPLITPYHASNDNNNNNNNNNNNDNDNDNNKDNNKDYHVPSTKYPE